MKVRYDILILFMLLGSIVTYSQNILTSTIQWTCTQTFDAQQGLMTDEITKIVSSPTQVTWYDSNDVVKDTFEISGTEGSWTNVSNNGSVTFTVSSGEDRALIQFTKQNSNISIRIHFLLKDGKSIYDLKVNNVNSL